MSIFTRIYAPRDYSLTGESRAHAEEIGLALAEWYHSDVPRKELKALMQRRRLCRDDSGIAAAAE